MRSKGKALINTVHVLSRGRAAATFHTARSEMLLGFLRVTGDNFHSCQEKYCSHHECNPCLDLMRMGKDELITCLGAPVA